MIKVSFIKKIFFFGTIIFFVSFFSTPALTSFHNVTVVNAAEVEDETPNIRLNVKKLSLVKEKSYKLRVRNTTSSQKIIFKSSDSDIASVNQQDDENKYATISGNSVGKATITVTIKEGYKTIDTLECEVTVGPPAISVKFAKAKVRIEIDQKTTLTTILKANNTTEIPRFTSSDSSIVSVSSTGRIVAKSLGIVEITATIDNKKTAICTVTVLKPGTLEIMD